MQFRIAASKQQTITVERNRPIRQRAEPNQFRAEQLEQCQTIRIIKTERRIMRDRNPGRTINRLECKRLVDQGRGILCGRDQTIQINRLLRLFCQAVEFLPQPGDLPRGDQPKVPAFKTAAGHRRQITEYIYSTFPLDQLLHFGVNRR